MGSGSLIASVFLDHRDELTRLIRRDATVAILKIEQRRLTRSRKRPVRAGATLVDEAQRLGSLASISKAHALRIGHDGAEKLGELAHECDTTSSITAGQVEYGPPRQSVPAASSESRSEVAVSETGLRRKSRAARSFDSTCFGTRLVKPAAGAW